MSTRSSIFYHPPIHIYDEYLDDFVYIEIEGKSINITARLWPTRRWWNAVKNPAWFARFMCDHDRHDYTWQPPKNTRSKSYQDVMSRSTWKCQKCGKVTSR